MSKSNVQKEKLMEMESQLYEFMRNNSQNEDDAMYAASVLMKLSMVLYTQLLGADDVKNLLKTISDEVEEIQEHVLEAFEEEDDDPFSGIDTTLPN